MRIRDLSSNIVSLAGLKRWAASALFLAFLMPCSITIAAVTVTSATGGGAIASNTSPGCSAVGTWTVLAGPVIAEANPAEIGVGSIVLSPPTGFVFNTAATVTILLTGNGTSSRNINNIATGTSVAVSSISATAIAFNVTEVSTRVNTLTWQGIQLRPSASAPLASGNITETGSSTITGATATTNFGTLAEVTSIPACNPRACSSVVTGNWSAPSTWNCGAGPGDGPPVATDSVTINGQTVSLDTSASAASLTINSGALQQAGSAIRSLSVSGNLSNSGTLIDNGTSGSLDLTVGGNLTGNGVAITVDNLTVGGNTTISKPLTANGNFNVGGDLTNNSAALTVGNLVFQKAGTQAATFYGTASVVTNVTVNSGSTVSSTNYSTLSLKGSLTNSGAINLPNTTWVINGSSAQSISGSTDSTLGNLTMNNVSGLTLSRNVSVPGTLTLTSGVINTGAFALASTANCPTAVSGGGANSYVNGNLRLTYPAWSVTCAYPVGDSAYAPITVAIPSFSGIAGGTLTGRTTGSEYPQVLTSGIDTYLDVNRYWTLGASGDTMATLPSAGSYSVNLGFAAADVDVGATVSSFKVGKYASSAWSALAGSASGSTATLTGQTSFGSFAVGTPLLPVSLAKTSSSAAAAVGSYVTFTLSVTNTNAVDLNNVVLTDIIPSSMTYLTNAATLGSATAAPTVPAPGQTLTWTIPSLPVGSSAQLTLVVQPTAQGTFTNTVTAGLKSASATILVLPNSFVQYKMDEAIGTWTDTATPGSVIDSGVNALNGHRKTTTSPTTTNSVSPTPTIASQQSSVVGGFCHAGKFDGKAVVETPYSPFFQFTQRLSASAWIYPTGTSYTPSGGDLSSIMSNDTNYEFHLNSTGHLYWWWNASSLTSTKIIPRDQWTHVAITMDSSLGANSRERIYINGVADTSTGSWAGTLQANACPFYIGGDITTGAGCALIPGRNFQGMIDEAKIYDYELSAAEVLADMNLGRQCGATFDHIRIEHDGTASTCAPKTVTLKACLNSSCTALYPGNVQVNLTPSGWVSGDTVTIKNGVTTATLNSGSITTPNTTLGGTAYGATLPTNLTARCFNGTTETCNLNVASTSCAFDAVEPTANPQTPLYTKLAGTAFNVDVLALTNSTTINQAFTGPVTVDLVDTSTSACSSSSTVLSTAQPTINFVSTDKGRKSVALTCNTAAHSAQVRIKKGTAYACSYDKLAVRPAQFAVSSSMTNAALTGTPKAVAGTAFTLTADSGVASGYTGTPVLDTSKVSDHNGDAIAGTLSGTFSAGTGKTASGSSFKYLDVGSIQLATDAVMDSTFTSVDQSGDCLSASASFALVSGKYGCNIGSAAPASKFGRWYPSHYSFIGTLTPTACVAGGFTYMDQDALLVDLSIKAHASTGLPAAATDPVLSRYNYETTAKSYPNLADVTFSGDSGGVAVSASRLGSPAFPALPAANKALWKSGQLQISETYAFSKPTAPLPPDGPYDSFKLMTSLIDNVDGPATLIGTSAQKETNTTRIRYGRVRLGNAYGSELLNLPLDLRIQYWGGTMAGWLSNTLDTCTVIRDSDFAFNPTAGNNLAPCETAITFGGAAPNYTASLLAPGAGNDGWTRLILNLGALAVGNQCTSKSASIGAASTTANAPWLQFNWVGTVDNPASHATFGVYRSGPIIHRREMY